MSAAQKRRWAKTYSWPGEQPVATEPCVSPVVYQAEVDKIFTQVWLCAARIEELPSAGSYKLKRLDFASTSALIIRGRDGSIRAFHDICSHRGNTVVVPEGTWDNVGRKNAFTCRFHAWTYSDQGELVGIQEPQGMSSCFKREDNGLTPIACEMWEGFVFINLDPKPTQSLVEFLGGMGQYFAGYPYHALTHNFTYHTVLNCNWKVGVDAFAEAYHVMTIHAGSFPGAFSTGLQMVKLYGDHRTTAVCFDPAREAPPVARLAQQKARGSLVNNVRGTSLPPTLNDEHREDYAFELSVIFPNGLLHVAEGIWFTHQLWPIGHDKCLWAGKYYVAPPRTNSERWALEHASVLQ